MERPTFASRRLTISKSKFFDKLKETEFRKLCVETVGKDNIQSLFVFNGGNATIIFSEVEDAVKVKNKLERMASDAFLQTDNFHSLQVRFSKDPCIRQLVIY